MVQIAIKFAFIHYLSSIVKATELNILDVCTGHEILRIFAKHD